MTETLLWEKNQRYSVTIMNVIAVKGIFATLSLNDVVRRIGKLINGPFEPMNFEANKGIGGLKTCYLRLSERLDPNRVVEMINSANVNYKEQKFIAYVPDSVPNLVLPERKRKIPLKIRSQIKLQELQLPHEVITNTHHEVFLELQYKYSGLFNLSKKTSHKLLDEIARIIGDRLIHVMDNSLESRDSCFMLSKNYRKIHPHFGDFQLILSTLHRLQDAAGAPRTQIQESELLACPVPAPMIGNIPLERVKTVCNKYSERVATAVMKHVDALDTNISQLDDEEQIARKKVREELKKIMPYMPSALKQVIAGHFVPEDQRHRRIRIYGEPYLPPRPAITSFIGRYNHGRGRIIRSQRMYNLIMCRVPEDNFAKMRAMDATVINGAKLTIRTDNPTYQEKETLRAELSAHYGGTPPQLLAYDAEDDEEYEEEDQEEEYEEE